MTEGQVLVELRDIRDKAAYTIKKIEAKRDARNARRRALYAEQHSPVPRNFDRDSFIAVQALLARSAMAVLCD